MEAPKSLKQKRDEPTMSYINKGHFYCISLKSSKKNVMMGLERVKSIISVVFGETKPDEEQLKHWKYWHSRYFEFASSQLEFVYSDSIQRNRE